MVMILSGYDIRNDLFGKAVHICGELFRGKSPFRSLQEFIN
jgi:hypothetical protein